MVLQKDIEISMGGMNEQRGSFKGIGRENRKLIIRKRPLASLGHIMRKVILKNLTHTRHTECKRNRGGQRA